MAVKGLKVGIRIRSLCFAPVKTVPHGGSDENLARTKHRRLGLAALKAKLRINCIDEPHIRVCMRVHIGNYNSHIITEISALLRILHDGSIHTGDLASLLYLEM